ncbi:MAG: pyridoxine 5'-phosphate synthase [Planctomycetaceae bacterium]|nr:pyridoxine 5'-phosphate synthase [Planctomycetaceae bacterium]
MPLLGVNIDHVATVRQARQTYEPDPVWAAVQAELGGADGITIHLREDRRHIQDRDVYLLKETVHVKLNLEMALAEEIVQIALKVLPDQVTLVPEKREEITTEGGLDLLAHEKRAAECVDRLKDAGIEVSLFIDPEREQVEAAARMGADAVELHTGNYADAPSHDDQEAELDRLTQAGSIAFEQGLLLHMGHGLTYRNVQPIADIPDVMELNIGHSIVARALMVGMEQAVSEMKGLISG